MKWTFAAAALHWWIGGCLTAQAQVSDLARLDIQSSDRWAAKVVTRYTGSFLDPSDSSRSSSWTALTQVVYKISPVVFLQGNWGFSQALQPTLNFTFTNPEFRVFYPIWGDPESWSWKVGPTLASPLSQNSQSDSLRFAFGAASRLTYHDQSDTGGFLFYYDLGLNRNLHQYETSSAGETNTMCSMDHYFYFEYAFDNPITLDAWMGFSSAWTYKGAIHNAFVLGQEINYTLTSWMDLSVGHERGGNFLSPNGQAYNFGIFDAHESRFYLAATLNF